MPNGFHGLPAEWEQLEAPLRRVDVILDEFAAQHGMTVERNRGSWPSRSLGWGAFPRREIQLHLEDPEPPTWTLWICAWEDREAQRYWQKGHLRRGVSFDEIESEVAAVLAEARETLAAWTSGDLEPAP